MHRFLRTARFWSLSHSFYKQRSTEFGQTKGSRKLNEWRRFTTLNRRDSITGSMQGEILSALQLGERSRASSLLLDLDHKNLWLRADDFIHILEYCARSPDPLFVLETLRMMEEKEIAMNNKCHFLIIRALCKGGYLEEALNLMRTFGEAHNIYPILPMYNNLLGACSELNNVNLANTCLDLMEHEMLGKNEVTYSELLKLAVLQQNLLAVHGIWKEFTKYYGHSILSLRKFIWSFTRLGDLKAAFGALQQMVALAFQGGFIITKTAEGKLSNSRLDIPIPSNGDLDWSICSKENETSVSSVFENYKKKNAHTSSMEHCSVIGSEMKEAKSVGMRALGKHTSGPLMKVLRWSFSDLIHACAQSRNSELAKQLFLQMQNIGVEPSCSTYDGVIRALVHERGFHDGLEILKLMQQKNLKPRDSTFATMSVSCSKDLELDLAEEFLDQMSKSSHTYPYNVFLEACCILDQPERAVRILGKMKQLKLQPDIRTYELLFSLFGNVNAPYEDGNRLSQVDAARRIKAIEEDMLRNGIQHSYLSIKNLISNE